MTGDVAERHYWHRSLTGLTFGRRGSPSYARIYDKTRHAEPDALIRQVWSRALGRPVRDHETVWRIEFEVRSVFLRELACNGEHISTDPRTMLVDHLDAIWRHLTFRWLVLRDLTSATRLARCRPEAWWTALASLEGLSASTGVPDVQRKRRWAADPLPLLRQLAGVLAAYGARTHNTSMRGCLDALEAHLVAHGGEQRFETAVDRARLRMR